MENRNAMIFGSVLLGGILVFSLYGIGSSFASAGFGSDQGKEKYSYDDEDKHEYEYRKYSKNRNGTNTLNNEE